MDFEGLKGDIIRMLAGGRVQVNVDCFQNDMKTFHTKDDVLTLLVSMACAVSLAYYSARKSCQMVRELPGGKGFADIVFLPLKTGVQPAVVVELKYNKSAWTAIEQIKERNYTQVLENYSGEIVLVGISYDKETKKHSCVIERQTKTG